MGKAFSPYEAGPLGAAGLDEFRGSGRSRRLFLGLDSTLLIPLHCHCLGQVVVPEELRFPHACCVGIASQTSLSLFNPSERWQQVSITVSSLAIDGDKVSHLLNSLSLCWSVVVSLTPLYPYIPTGIPTGGQPALPVAHIEEQDHHRAQDHRGAEGAVHSPQSWRLPVRPDCLLLACVRRDRGLCPGQHLRQEGAAGRHGREPRAGGEET